ncbi:MAG TPA: response regulator transcription factor [Ktedonobacteraceae bacterium]|jgi:DNA-binding NarL/FixJ family response regulator|nr:response regulator transcription factor [Ktedonobacteraceae bacterium]
MSSRIRVLIVDDQTLVREGFRKLLELEPDFEVIDTASDGEAAVSATERLYAAGTPPDVLLMDIRMPRMDGIAATHAIKARWPDAHIVILTTFDEVELISAGLHAGALGYLLKDITSEQLATTIRAAARGQVLLQAEIANKVFSTLPSTPPPKTTSSSPTMPDLPEPLTEREREILALVAKGASNRQISETLFITEGTVKNHLSNILGKLGVRDRTQAALKAREWGLG